MLVWPVGAQAEKLTQQWSELLKKNSPAEGLNKINKTVTHLVTESIATSVHVQVKSC